MKIINIEDLKKYNKNVIDFNEEYLSIYSYYYSLLLDYFLNNSSIKTVDDEFSNSELNFVSVKEENMDIFQYMSSEKLKYFYIRNIMHIERLNEEEKKYLVDRMNSNSELDEGLESFLQNTMSKVIYEGTGKENENVFYGPLNDHYMLPANSLVIGFRYDEFNSEGIPDDKWDIFYDRKESEKLNYFRDIDYNQDKFKNVLIRFLEYNDFTIQKKSNNSNIKL